MEIKTIPSLLDIPWSLKALDSSKNPFSTPRFYQLCERAKVVGSGAGWIPLYFVALENKEVQGLLPAFIKTNSFGEFIFDWTWADYYQRTGLSYYPKLVSALPFSPVNVSKTLSLNKSAKKALLAAFSAYLDSRENLSSGHVLFSSEEENEILKDFGFFERETIQYHFRLEHDSFEGFLSSLKTRKRKQFRKERKAVEHSNLDIKVVENSFTPEFTRQVHELYLTTLDKKWSQAYLNEDFFQMMARDFSESIVVIGAYKENKMVAMSYFVKSEDTLYGRYWGVLPEENVPYLHFELSFYQGIEYCAKRGLKLFEAGAQGEQKLLRGFRPVKILSAHKLSFAPVHKVIHHHVKMENAYVQSQLRELERFLPYKQESAKLPTPSRRT